MAETDQTVLADALAREFSRFVDTDYVIVDAETQRPCLKYGLLQVPTPFCSPN